MDQWICNLEFHIVTKVHDKANTEHTMQAKSSLNSGGGRGVVDSGGKRISHCSSFCSENTLHTSHYRTTLGLMLREVCLFLLFCFVITCDFYTPVAREYTLFFV